MPTENETLLTRELIDDTLSQFEERFAAGREQELVKRKAARDATGAAAGWANFVGGQAYKARLNQRTAILVEALTFATAPEVESTVTAMRTTGKPVAQGMSRVFGYVSGDLPDGLMVALRKVKGSVLTTSAVDVLGKYQIDTPCTDKEVLIEVHDTQGQLLLQDGAPIILKDGVTVQRNFTITRCGDIVVEAPDDDDQSVVRMPALLQSTEVAAKTKLAELGNFQIELKREFDNGPRGTVIAQSPDPDTVLTANSQIALIISNGPEPQSKMPDVIGDTLPNARSILADFDYGSLAVDYIDAPDKVGLVVKQTPKAGTPLAEDAPVLLCVGQAQKLMPDIVGNVESAARAILIPKIVPAIKVSYVEVTDNPSIVQKQIPAAGTVVTDQTAVELVVGKAPEPQDILMPELKGQTVAAGRKVLKTRGDFVIKIKQAPSDMTKGRIFAQEPEAQTPINRGDPVTLHVSTGAEDKLATPRLTGLSLARAEATLVPKYTNDMVVKYAASNKKAGIVIDQTPKAGEQMVVGAPVMVTISKPRDRGNTPLMPDLAGLKITEAKRRLATVNLSKLDYDKTAVRKRNWQIVAQDPAPGVPLRGDEVVAVKFGPKT